MQLSVRLLVLLAAVEDFLGSASRALVQVASRLATECTPALLLSVVPPLPDLLRTSPQALLVRVTRTTQLV